MLPGPLTKMFVKKKKNTYVLAGMHFLFRFIKGDESICVAFLLLQIFVEKAVWLDDCIHHKFKRKPGHKTLGTFLCFPRSSFLFNNTELRNSPPCEKR